MQPERTRLFLSQFDRRKGCRSVEIGWTGWLTDAEYADINTEMVRIAGEYIDWIVSAADATERERDLNLARDLMKKHNVEVTNVE